MANAFDTFKAQTEAIQWIFTRSYFEQWRRENPDGSVEDLIEDCRKRANAATDRLVDVEVENGATRAQGERMVRSMY